MSTRAEILESMAKNVEALGPWLAASIDDPKACAEYVAAGRQVLESLQALRELAAAPPFPWADIRGWVRWAAMDATGYWTGFVKKPHQHPIYPEWWAVGHQLVLNLPQGGHGPWRESLQQRPE